MPDSIQTIIDRVRSCTGTTAMEYTEYRDVLALCNFAEQAQADLARMASERDALRARVAELESSCRDLRVAYEQNASQCVRLNRELALKLDTVEWLNGVTIQRQRAEQAEARVAELEACISAIRQGVNRA